jgi:signal transduction histidine kinase
MKYTLLIVSIFLFQTNLNSQNKTQELFKLSDLNYKRGDYAEALSNCIEALKIIEGKSDHALTAYGNYRVGRMYYILNNRATALNYFYKSRQIIYGKNIDSLKFIVSYNIGVIYTEIGAVDSALTHYAIAEKELVNRTNPIDHLKLNAVIADLHMNQTSNFVLAKQYAKKAEEFANKCNSDQWKAFSKMKFAIFYMRTKEYELAKKYAIEAQILFDKVTDLDGKMYSHRVLTEILIRMADPGAKDAFLRLLNLRDSTFKVETATKIAQYQTLYETEKKIAENKFLQQRNELNKAEIAAKNKTIIGLLIGVLLIVITIFWRVSVMNLKKKNRELEAAQAIQKEKERISRDLHDNVGGQLSYVLYSLDGINTDDKSKRTEITGNVNESVRNVISNLRETIWAINDEAISINDFSDKLKVYVRSMFRNTETKISFTENILIDTQLNSLVGLNLYRICQEIINNAFKHSKATELIVNITSEDKVIVEIVDNGVGFDLESVEKDGFGLANIKSRAAEVGITLELESKRNDGVKYKLLV